METWEKHYAPAVVSSGPLPPAIPRTLEVPDAVDTHTLDTIEELKRNRRIAAREEARPIEEPPAADVRLVEVPPIRVHRDHTG